MSIACMNHVWHHSRATLGSRLVLLAIADYADEHNRAWPSIATLAKKSLMSERQAQRALATLTQLGEVKVHYQEGPRGVNVYEIIHNPCQIVTPTNCHPVENVTPGVSEMSPLGVSDLSPKPSVEPPENHQYPPTPPKGVDAQFEEFWADLPKQNRVGKKKAHEQWDKALKDGTKPEDILEGLYSFKKYERKRRQQNDYRPLHPATWLHQGRWQDDEVAVNGHEEKENYNPWD